MMTFKLQAAKYGGGLCEVEVHSAFTLAHALEKSGCTEREFERIITLQVGGEYRTRDKAFSVVRAA